MEIVNGVPYVLFDWRDSGIKWMYYDGVYAVHPKAEREFIRYVRTLLNQSSYEQLQ